MRSPGYVDTFKNTNYIVSAVKLSKTSPWNIEIRKLQEISRRISNSLSKSRGSRSFQEDLKFSGVSRSFQDDGNPVFKKSNNFAASFSLHLL